MEYSRLLDEKVIVTLCKELKLNKDQIYYSEAPLSMSFISQIRDKLHGKKDLFLRAQSAAEFPLCTQFTFDDGAD